MFTNRIASYYSAGKVLIEAACLSTDTKPTDGIANGSLCLEMDTGKIYAFNEEASEWIEIGSSSGGGGGDDGDLIFITEETITTEADSVVGTASGEFSYSSVIKSGTIIVTFDGTEYECSRIDGNDTYYYGGYSFVDPDQPDFSEYPFIIFSEFYEEPVYNVLVTENAGTYTVKIEGTPSTPA